MLREAAILLHSPLLSLRLHTYIHTAHIHYIYTFIYSAITSHPFTAPPTGRLVHSAVHMHTHSKHWSSETLGPASSHDWMSHLLRWRETIWSLDIQFTTVHTHIYTCDSLWVSSSSSSSSTAVWSGIFITHTYAISPMSTRGQPLHCFYNAIYRYF